jgi:hypothetical protein
MALRHLIVKQSFHLARVISPEDPSGAQQRPLLSLLSRGWSAR